MREITSTIVWLAVDQYIMSKATREQMRMRDDETLACLLRHIDRLHLHALRVQPEHART